MCYSPIRKIKNIAADWGPKIYGNGDFKIDKIYVLNRRALWSL
jgi:hypothetical protein